MRMNAEDVAAVRTFAGADDAAYARLLIGNPDMDRRTALAGLQRAKDHRADERALEAWRRGRYAGPKPVPVALTRRREAEAAKLATARAAARAKAAAKAHRAAMRAHAAEAARVAALPPFERLAAIHGRQSDGTVRVPAQLLPHALYLRAFSIPFLHSTKRPETVTVRGGEQWLARADLGAAGVLPAPRSVA